MKKWKLMNKCFMPDKKQFMLFPTILLRFDEWYYTSGGFSISFHWLWLHYRLSFMKVR